MRRALTWDERLTVVQWYLDRIDLRPYEQTGDTAARDRTIIYLLGAGESKEAIAASFGLTVGGVTRIINRIKREHGVKVAAEKSATKSGSRNSDRQVVP